MLETYDRGREGAAREEERIVLGSVVTLEDLNSADEWAVTIVSTHAADPEANCISDECPLGEALLGRHRGDIVRLEVPLGKVQYRVTAVTRPRSSFDADGQQP